MESEILRKAIEKALEQSLKPLDPVLHYIPHKEVEVTRVNVGELKGFLGSEAHGEEKCNLINAEVRLKLELDEPIYSRRFTIQNKDGSPLSDEALAEFAASIERINEENGPIVVKGRIKEVKVV